MKKILQKLLNVILLLLIGAILLFPQTTPTAKAAATPSRYYRTYRTNLEGFLTNWRTNAPGTCVRTSQRPDGTTSQCLSMSKISGIMAQLDTDGYFKIQDALARRQYLMNTTHQTYVMRKVVMYFEQVLNPNTIVYGATQDIKNNYVIFDTVLDALHLIAGGSNPSTGDSILLVFATNSKYVSGGPLLPVYEYSVKPKSQILQGDLDRIYKTSRMSQYAAFNSSAWPNWEANETTELNKVVDIGNKVLNYARSHKVTPSYAKAMMNSQQTAQIALGVVGAGAKVGGMTLIEGAAISEFRVFAVETYQIGRYQAKATVPVMDRLFQRSTFDTAVDLTTGISPIHEVMGGVSQGMNAVSKVLGQSWWIPDADSVLTDIFLNRTYVVSFSIMQKEASTNYLVGGLYRSSTRSIFLLDGNVSSAAHEAIHALRCSQASKLGFPSGSGFGMEDITEWTTRKVLARTNTIFKANNAGFKPEYIEGIAEEIAKRGNTSLLTAENNLFQIQSNFSYQEIDNSLGRPGFWNTFNALRTDEFNYRNQPHNIVILKQKQDAIWNFIHNK